MKRTSLILIFIVSQYCFGYSQNDWQISVCDCYTNLDYSVPFENLKKQVELCVEKSTKEYKKEFKALYASSNNSLEFLQKIGKFCPEFYEFIARFGLDGEEITDEERLEIIDFIALYFSYPIEKGKTPNVYTIIPTEQAVLYNKYFNQIYPDSIFNEGTHIIPYYDSLIVFDLFPKWFETSISLKLSDNSEPKLDLTYVIKLKKDKIGYLLKSFRYSYDKTMLLPEVRLSTRKALSHLTVSELQQLDNEEISNMIIDSTFATEYFNEYASLIKVYIDNIDYPEILNLAIEADLIEEYNALKTNDYDKKINAIDNLFNNSSKQAYEILLQHWQFEYDKKVKEYILNKLTSRNN